MNFIAWIVAGIVVGWVANVLMSMHTRRISYLNIMVSVIGAVTGGWLLSPFFEESAYGRHELSWASFIISVLSAFMLLCVIYMIVEVDSFYQQRHNRRNRKMISPGKYLSWAFKKGKQHYFGYSAIEMQHQQAQEELLDAAIEMSFPASDPIAIGCDEPHITKGPDKSNARLDHQNAARIKIRHRY